jgi:hypothetical protein
VVDELPDEGRPRRVGRVVRIVRAQAGVRDELDRAGAQRVLRVQWATLGAECHQRLLDPLTRLSERRQVWKQPSEVLPIGGDESAARGCPHERTRQSRRSAPAERKSACPGTNSRQESASAIASRQRSAIVLLGHLNPPPAALVLSAPRRRKPYADSGRADNPEVIPRASGREMWRRAPSQRPGGSHDPCPRRDLPLRRRRRATVSSSTYDRWAATRRPTIGSSSRRRTASMATATE